MSIRAIVVDDEPLARDELRFLLEQCEGIEVVAEAESAQSAVDACKAEQLDVAFVDLHMPGPDGIALAESLKLKHPNIAIVIVSAHDDGAIRAFESQIVDYLLKPVRLERLRKSVERAIEYKPPTKKKESAQTTIDRLAVRRQGSYVVVDMTNVVYFEVRDELVWAITQTDRFAIDKTLTVLEAELDTALFFRSHRGFIVKIDAIKAIEPAGKGMFELQMDHPDAPRIPLARERAKQLKARIPFMG